MFSPFYPQACPHNSLSLSEQQSKVSLINKTADFEGIHERR